jgi:hypothetical protein
VRSAPTEAGAAQPLIAGSASWSLRRACGFCYLAPKICSLLPVASGQQWACQGYGANVGASAAGLGRTGIDAVIENQGAYFRNKTDGLVAAKLGRVLINRPDMSALERTGHRADIAQRPSLTLMYGPAVRCKKISPSWGVCDLASMYPAFVWSLLCPGPSWISARLRSRYRTGLNGPFGSPVFACAGKTDPPSRFHPLADLGR